MYILEEVGHLCEPNAVIAVSASIDNLIRFAKEVSDSDREVHYLHRDENLVVMQIGTDMFEIYEALVV